MTVKVTLNVDRQYLIRAASIANRFILEWLPRDGPRLKHRDCMIVGPPDDHDQSFPNFSIWGDEKHVRVYQCPGYWEVKP